MPWVHMVDADEILLVPCFLPCACVFYSAHYYIFEPGHGEHGISEGLFIDV